MAGTFGGPRWREVRHDQPTQGVRCYGPGPFGGADRCSCRP